jgi:hypothetical protein
MRLPSRAKTTSAAQINISGKRTDPGLWAACPRTNPSASSVMASV